MNQDWINQFREKLDQHYSWPALYTFKFIVPKGKEDDLKRLFASHHLTEKKSGKGNFISFTFQMMANSSDRVIEIYQLASDVEGIIAL